MQYRQRHQQAFFCLLRHSLGASSLCVTANQVDKNGWFYLRTRKKARSLAQNDNHPGRTPTILQSSIETVIFSLQAFLLKSIQSFFPLLIPIMRAKTQASHWFNTLCLCVYSPATLAAVKSVDKYQLQQPLAPSFPAFQANIYAVMSAVSYKQSTFSTSTIGVIAY